MSEGRFSGLSGVLGGSAAAITAIGGVIAILVQVGVIGGDETNRTTTQVGQTRGQGSVVQPPRKQDWAAQANEICEQTNDDIKALPEPETLDPSQLTGSLREAVDISQRQLRELAKLTPPEDDGPKVKRLLRIYAQQNDAAEEMAGALRIGDVTGLQTHVDTLKRLGRTGDDLADQLGATTCAEGASFAGTELPAG